MSEKKKNILSGLFKSSGGCGCGVTIVEEPKKVDESKEKSDSKNENKK